jgi:hypothetical protein
MTAQDYAAMFKSVPHKGGLGAVGHAFLQESIDEARRMQSVEKIKQYAAAQNTKWKEFCALVADVDLPADLKPNPDAFAILEQKLLLSCGFPADAN